MPTQNAPRAPRRALPPAPRLRLTVFCLLALSLVAAFGPLAGAARSTSGTVVAWGDNQYGQLNVPAGLSGVVAVSAGGRHNLALKADGTVAAWGDNSFGQSTVPAGLAGVAAVSDGSRHSLALVSTGLSFYRP